MNNPRKKKCKVCKEPFSPWNTTQTACSPTCAIELAKAAREKKELKELREAKQRLKTKSQWMKEAQQAFNAFIRKRDYYQPCISCDRQDQENEYSRGGIWDCGHYRSVGSAPELRFEELNAHKQCKKCNNQLSGNVVEYRIRLKDRIGEKNLEWLEGSHEAKHYTIEDLKEIKAFYKQKAKELEAA